ncbi:unnamed protein product, partial [Effrenium voratum]
MTDDDESSPVLIRRSRSFSGYVPYELSYEEPQEAATVWPDTDDEEEIWQVQRSGSFIEDADARKLQVSLEAALPMATARAKCSGCMLPIPHRPVGYADAVRHTNPQSTPLSPGMITARASPGSSTLIAAGPLFSDASDDEKGYSTCKSRASRSSRLEGLPK